MICIKKFISIGKLKKVVSASIASNSSGTTSSWTACLCVNCPAVVRLIGLPTYDYYSYGESFSNFQNDVLLTAYLVQIHDERWNPYLHYEQVTVESDYESLPARKIVGCYRTNSNFKNKNISGYSSPIDFTELNSLRSSAYLLDPFLMSEDNTEGIINYLAFYSKLPIPFSGSITAEIYPLFEENIDNVSAGFRMFNADTEHLIVSWESMQYNILHWTVYTLDNTLHYSLRDDYGESNQTQSGLRATPFYY